jgi:hypothetical protein
LQLFKSAKLSRPSSSSNLCGIQEALYTVDPLLKIDLQISPSPSEDSVPKRVPLAGSVTVSSRTELYHDLLCLQLPPSGHPNLQDLNSLRNSIQLFEQTLENTIRLVYALCSLVEGLEADPSSWTAPYAPVNHLISYGLSNRQLSILFSIRSDIRLNILQYVLGLDERWSLDATIASCRFVKLCFEQYVHDPALLSFPRPLSFRLSTDDHRRSQFAPSPTIELLALTLPAAVCKMRCRVAYSLAEDGPGVAVLRRGLLDSDQHALVLIQDSYGYLFGAFLSFHTHQREVLRQESSYLFRALPDLRKFPLPKR